MGLKREHEYLPHPHEMPRFLFLYSFLLHLLFVTRFWKVLAQGSVIQGIRRTVSTPYILVWFLLSWFPVKPLSVFSVFNSLSPWCLL